MAHWHDASTWFNILIIIWLFVPVILHYNAMIIDDDHCKGSLRCCCTHAADCNSFLLFFLYFFTFVLLQVKSTGILLLLPQLLQLKQTNKRREKMRHPNWCTFFWNFFRLICVVIATNLDSNFFSGSSNSIQQKNLWSKQRNPLMPTPSSQVEKKCQWSAGKTTAV